MKVKNPVYVNADRTKALPEGHQNAAFLLVGRNGTIADEIAAKYGITEEGIGSVLEDEGAPKTAEGGVPQYMVNESASDGVNTDATAPAAIPHVSVPVDGKDSFGKPVRGSKKVQAPEPKSEKAGE